MPGWFRFRLFAGGRFVYDGDGDDPRTEPRTFWSKSISIFGLHNVTTFISGSHELTMPSNPGTPTTLVLAVAAITSRRGRRPFGRGLVVPRASHDPIAPTARLGRVLEVELQVGFRRSAPTATYPTSCRTSSALRAFVSPDGS